MAQVTKPFTDFKENNKAAIQSTKGGKLEAIQSMKDTLSALPGYQERKAKFSVRIFLSRLYTGNYFADRLASILNYHKPWLLEKWQQVWIWILKMYQTTWFLCYR